MMKLSIRSKVLFALTAIILVMTLITSIVVHLLVNNLLINEKLLTSSHAGLNIIDHIYPGDWHIHSDKLYKGEFEITDSITIVEDIKRLTGAEITLFAHDKSLISSIVSENGSHLSEIVASSRVSETVLIRGMTFTGESNMSDTRYLTSYVPLLDSDGKPVGMLGTAMLKSKIGTILSHFNKSFLLVILPVALLLFIFAYKYITRFTKGLSGAIEDVHTIASGNLKIESQIHTADEIGTLSIAIQDTAQQLRHLIHTIQNSSYTVKDSSGMLSEIIAKTQNMSSEIAMMLDGVANLAQKNAEISDVSAEKMHTLEAHLDHIQERADHLQTLSESTKSSSAHGQMAISDLILNTETTENHIQELSESIKYMGDKMSSIDTITETILSISEKTNLLALNAAIESAKAKEHGKGFSVISSEIRSLAEQSKRSSAQIQKTISGIQRDVKKAVSMIDALQAVFLTQNQSVQVTKDTFNSIDRSVLTMVNGICKIASHTSDIQTVKVEVVDLMDQISISSRMTSSSTQQASATGEEQLASMEEMLVLGHKLHDLSLVLQNSVDVFVV